jgi:hypothetical protein
MIFVNTEMTIARPPQHRCIEAGDADKDDQGRGQHPAAAMHFGFRCR